MPQLRRAPEAISLDLSPPEVAARLRHLPGLVFFDSATEADGGAISVISAAPQAIIEGGDWNVLRAAIAERSLGGAVDDGIPHGFAAGFVEYEGRFCFGIYEQALIYRHDSDRWYSVGDLHHAFHEPPARPAVTSPQFSPQMTRDEFCDLVRRAQNYIAAGDIYQVNLAHEFVARWTGDAFQFYGALRHYSPAPMAAFLELGGKQVLSASPESFLRMSSRAIRTRPIKGTRPRHADINADEKSAFDLITSPKEIAELVMITDLERNDLGAICEYGSVRATELLKLERHAQVFHLVSTVEGELRPEIDHVAALRACFPGGSITGAPKKRAREIIAELEPIPRGLYTGAIGWIGFNGESQFSIAIRTVVAEHGEARFHVGAGIVADSVPEAEWQETLDKAAGILLAARAMGDARR